MPDNNTRAIAHFSLPRPDWYDSDGRINKTALIVNFNALESRINLLSGLKVTPISAPDINDISLEDVTLESDDNKIVNLRSLINILNFKNIPFNVEFDGTKLKKLNFYNDSYQLVTLSDITITPRRYIFLNTALDNIISRDNYSPSYGTLIGCYQNGMVYVTSGNNLIDKLQIG